MDRYARPDKEKNSYLISAFLITQIGKKYALGEEKRITGAESVTEEVQRKIGNGVCLDYVDDEHLIHFHAGVRGCRKFSERVKESSNTNYLQSVKFLCRENHIV